MVPDESGKAFDSGVATRQRASAPTYRPPRHLLEPSRAAIRSLPAHRVRICYSPQFGRVKALYTVRPINQRLQHRRCLPPSSFIVFGSFRSRAGIKRCGFHTLRKSVGRIWRCGLCSCPMWRSCSGTSPSGRPNSMTGTWSKITLRKSFAHPYRHSRRIV
jgi:hypothetical protein